MSAGDQPEVYQESFTSAAVDGARISCVTASVLVQLDKRIIEEGRREFILEQIELARQFLDIARKALPDGPVTSVHIVGANEAAGSGLIIPR
jgi:hypothetical protein